MYLATVLTVHPHDEFPLLKDYSQTVASVLALHSPHVHCKFCLVRTEW